MKRNHFLLTIIFLMITGSLNADELKSFTSDGCSSFPDGTLKQKQLWLNCCQVHDKAYWQGGTSKQRLEADQSLAECVAQVGEPQIAKLMLAGVRVGGSPKWPTSFRWGYGWAFPRNYGKLTEDENIQVLKLWQEYQNKVESDQK